MGLTIAGTLTLMLGTGVMIYLGLTGQWFLFIISIPVYAFNWIVFLGALFTLIDHIDRAIDEVEKEPDPLADFTYAEYLKDIGRFPLIDLRQRS